MNAFSNNYLFSYYLNVHVMKHTITQTTYIKFKNKTRKNYISKEEKTRSFKITNCCWIDQDQEANNSCNWCCNLRFLSQINLNNSESFMGVAEYCNKNLFIFPFEPRSMNTVIRISTVNLVHSAP